LTPRTGESPMMEWFFSKGLDSLQDSYRSGADKIGADGGWFFLVAGSLFAAYVMYGWWKDVAAESKAGDHTPVVDIGLRYGMIMFIMQEAMFFVGWFWMFFEIGLFHKMRAGWNTLFLTVALGILFTFVQGYEYLELFHHQGEGGGHPWLSADAYGSAFFMATGFHGLHVLIGTIFLAIMYLRLVKGVSTSSSRWACRPRLDGTTKTWSAAFAAGPNGPRRTLPGMRRRPPFQIHAKFHRELRSLWSGFPK